MEVWSYDMAWQCGCLEVLLWQCGGMNSVEVWQCVGIIWCGSVYDMGKAEACHSARLPGLSSSSILQSTNILPQYIFG